MRALRTGSMNEDIEGTKTGTMSEDIEDTRTGTMNEDIEDTRTGTISEDIEGTKTGTMSEDIEGTRTGTMSEDIEGTKTGTMSEDIEGTRTGTMSEDIEGTKTGTMSEDIESTRTGSMNEDIEDTRTGSMNEDIEGTKTGSMSEDIEGTRTGSMSEDIEGTRTGTMSEDIEGTRTGSMNEDIEGTKTGTMSEETSGKPPFAMCVVFYMLGIATLLPWNFFITAETYWQYKLRNVSLGEEEDWDTTTTATTASNTTLTTTTTTTTTLTTLQLSTTASTTTISTTLQLSFTPTLVIISNVVATAFFFVTSAIVTRVSEPVRLGGSLGVSLLAMLLVTCLTLINSDSWQTTFFIVTMVIVALLNVSIAVALGSSCGLAGVFPAACMTSVVSGQAMAGVFSSLTRLVSLAVGEEPTTSGLVYFLIADVFLLATIAGYVALRKMWYYVRVKQEAAMEEETRGTSGVKRDIKDYLAVLKKIWLMGTTQAVAFALTLSVYPSVVVYVTSTLPESRWTQVFFQPTVTFLLMNLGDWVGREVSRWVKWPGPRGWLLHVLGAARVVFVPLLLLCHGRNKTFPTFFNHDAYYIAINALFSFTNGYIISLTFIYYSMFLEADECELGGAIMVALSGVGVVVGSLVSPALVKLWGPV